MLMSHQVCAVESFRIELDPERLSPPRIVLEGWFLSHESVSAMRLVFADGVAHDIVDRDRDSPDIAAHHGGAFGERATRARFAFAASTGGPEPDYVSGELHVRTQGGEMLVLALGRELRIGTVGGPFGDVPRLLAAFDTIGPGEVIGTVRRRFGVSPSGLLGDAVATDRFALSAAVEGRFAGLDRPGAIRLEAERGEWVAHVPAALLAWRTGRQAEASVRATVLAEARAHLLALARSFLLSCSSGLVSCSSRRGIMVHQSAPGSPDIAAGGASDGPGIRRLHLACRSLGPVRSVWLDNMADGEARFALTGLGDGLWRLAVDPGLLASDGAARSAGAWLAALIAVRDALDGGTASFR